MTVGQITFACACGQSITVGPQFAGKMGRCPRCKQPVLVPAPGVAAAPPVMAPPPMAPPAPARPTAPMGAPPRGATPAQGIPRPAPAAQKPAAARGASSAKLMLVTGPAAVQGRTFALAPGKPTVIGRDPTADLSVPSERISRKHCQLEPTADGLFVLSDLGSSNGTLVNQERIQGRKVLLGGEYIQIGDCLFRFSDS